MWLHSVVWSIHRNCISSFPFWLDPAYSAGTSTIRLWRFLELRLCFVLWLFLFLLPYSDSFRAFFVWIVFALLTRMNLCALLTRICESVCIYLFLFSSTRIHWSLRLLQPPAAFAPFGNHYATIYPSAANAAETMDLTTTVTDINAWHSAFFGTMQQTAHAQAQAEAEAEAKSKGNSNSIGHGELKSDAKQLQTKNAKGAAAPATLPTWLADVLVNSLSHSRDLMWFETCPHCTTSADGRVNGTLAPEEGGFWRQWEAYVCLVLFVSSSCYFIQHMHACKRKPSKDVCVCIFHFFT